MFISLIMSIFFEIFSFCSLSGFFRVPNFIFSSRSSISLNFFFKFFNLLAGSDCVVGSGGGLLNVGSVISHFPSLSAASSTAEI